MGKVAPDPTLDALLLEVATANNMRITAGEPIDHADAVTKTLAAVAMVPGVGVDYVIGDGGSGGRALDMTAKPNIPITATGTGDHVVLTDDTGTKITYITTATALPLDVGGGSNTVTIPTWKITANDPV